MFSLVITIISIALVAVLALATIYYGGQSFNAGSDQAKAAQMLNEGQQIQGANVLRTTDQSNNALAGTALTSLDQLKSGGYLASIPGQWTLDLATGTIKSGVISPAACAAVTTKATNGTSFWCDSNNIVSYRL